MLNKTDSVPFHLIVGTHALRSLWVLIQRRHCTQTLCYNQPWICCPYYECGKLLLLPAVCRNGRLSQFCSGRTGKTFFSPLYSLCCCCSVSGKRGCSNLHCFACWLMLCLWERAQCEVNSCASQYHCIPLFSVSSLSVCYSALVRTKLLCWRWCHCLLCENSCVPKIVIIELS